MSAIGLALLLATLATNILVARYENRRGHELSSELLIADAAATRTDIFITIGVLIGLVFARQGYLWVDPAVAIVGGDPHGARRLSDPQAHHTGVGGRAGDSGAHHSPDGAGGRGREERFYGIRSRGGPASVRYAEVTIAVDPAANVADAHAIADAVEERLKKDLQLEEVTVHVEPC